MVYTKKEGAYIVSALPKKTLLMTENGQKHRILYRGLCKKTSGSTIYGIAAELWWQRQLLRDSFVFDITRDKKELRRIINVISKNGLYPEQLHDWVDDYLVGLYG